jgi:hypothetical protein
MMGINQVDVGDGMGRWVLLALGLSSQGKSQGEVAEEFVARYYGREYVAWKMSLWKGMESMVKRESRIVLLGIFCRSGQIVARESDCICTPHK